MSFQPADCGSIPYYTCDGCGKLLTVRPRGRRGMPFWFMRGKPPRGWWTGVVDNKRRDYCPQCKDKRP